MPTYTVQFRTYTHYADRDIEAVTPHQALSQARKLVDCGQADHELVFKPYEEVGRVNEIEVQNAKGTALQVWQNEELALEYAAADLRNALRDLVDRELAKAAKTGLDDHEISWLDEARLALSSARGGVR